MAVQLTGGAVECFSNGNKYPGDVPVILQILNFKRMAAPGGGPERIRVLVSDGVHTLNSAMLAPALNHMHESGEMDMNCVVSCRKYSISTLAGNDKKVLMISDCDVLKQGSDTERIGKPTPYTKPAQDNTPNNPTPQKPPPASPQAGGRVFSANPTTPLTNRTAQLNSPMVGRSPGGSTHPIVGLNPYQNKWVIKARCMNKSALRTYNNAKGPGKLFNFEVADHSGTVRITGFNEQVDKFFEMIEPQKVYLITGCSVKAANKQYNKTGHDYELTLTGNSLIEPVADDGEAPKLSFDFVPIEKLPDVEQNALVDCIGVVESVDEPTEITSKATQKTFIKREITLVDNTNKSVRVTLWGDDAQKFDRVDKPVLAIKGAVVKEFGGRSLSMGGNSSYMVDPDVPEAHFLKGWYAQQAGSLQIESLSSGKGVGGGGQFMSIAEARDNRLGMGEKADYYTTKATFIFFKKDGNVLYPGCKGCMKKLIDEGNGYYRCEKCNTSTNEFDWRSILTANVADWSDNCWVTLFNETAEQVLNVPMQQLGQLRESGDEQAYTNVFAEANFSSALLKLRVKMESYNDETRLKHILQGVTPVNPVEHGHRLLADIDRILAK